MGLGGVLSSRVSSTFPRPSFLQVSLGQLSRTLAMCFRSCWPLEAAAQSHCRAVLFLSRMFTPCLHPWSLPLPHSPVTPLPHFGAQLCCPLGCYPPQGGQSCPGCPDRALAPWHVPGSGVSAVRLVKFPLKQEPHESLCIK